jgi:hypothetical protein
VFAKVVIACGQEISVKKTEVLVVQPRDTRCHVEEPYRMKAEADDTNKKVGTIIVYRKALEVVSEFKYVGSIENKFADTFEEIRIRRQRAGQALAENAFENARLKLNTRYKAFISIVISNMLCASETWNTLSSEVARLDSLQYQKLSLILGLNWKDKCSYAQGVKNFARYGVAVDTIAIMVSFRRLRYVGHIERGTACGTRTRGFASRQTRAVF